MLYNSDNPMKRLLDEVCMSERDITSTRRFMSFLYNRAHSELMTSYGLLVSYESETILKDFLMYLENAILPMDDCKYKLYKVEEKNLRKTTFAGKNFDRNSIVVVTDLAADGTMNAIVESFSMKTEIIRIVCASMETVKNRIMQDDAFYYRFLPVHIHLNLLTAREITNRFLNVVKEEYSTTDAFDQDIAYYIDTIYDQADLKDYEFIDDLMRRVLTSMEEQEGVLAYKKGHAIDRELVPYSKKVVLRRQAEQDTQNILDQIPEENIPSIQKEEEIDVVTEVEHLSIENMSELNLPDRMNVFLVALSTFNQRELQRGFSYHDFIYKTKSKDILIKGIYQLDPVPYLLKELGQSLDYVILLATKKTREKVDLTSLEEDFEDNISPEDYFKKHLMECFGPEHLTEKHIRTINLDEHAPAEAINETAKLLLELIEQKKVHLYMDSHGGFRDTQLIMEAIVSLLPKESLEIEKYSILFDDKDKEKSYIVQDESLRIFDFVSGINEFINYGRCDSLLNYLNYNESKDLIDPIQKISEALLWCNAKMFAEELAHLRNYYRKKKTVKDKYLQIFVDRIHQSYKALLQDEELDTCHVVEWALDKGFYQQALTFTEALMAETLIRRNIYMLTATGEDFKKKHRIREHDVELSATDILNGCVFAAFATPKKETISSFNDLFKKSPDFDKAISGMSQILIRFMKGTYRSIDGDINYDKLLETMTTSKVNCYNGAVEEASVISFEVRKGILNDTRKKRLSVFFFLHKILKDARNKANHVLDNPYNQKSLENAMKFYIGLAEKLSI